MKVPRPKGPFVGRHKLVRFLEAHSDARAVVLVGPPGRGRRRVVAESGFGEAATWLEGPEIGDAKPDDAPFVLYLPTQTREETERLLTDLGDEPAIVAIAEEPPEDYALSLPVPPLTKEEACVLLERQLQREAPLLEVADDGALMRFSDSLRGFPGAFELVAKRAASLGASLFSGASPASSQCLEPIRSELRGWYSRRAPADRELIALAVVSRDPAASLANAELLGEAELARGARLGVIWTGDPLVVDPLIAASVEELPTDAAIVAARRRLARWALQGCEEWPRSWSKDPDLLAGLRVRAPHLQAIVSAALEASDVDDALDAGLHAGAALVRLVTETGDPTTLVEKIDALVESARGRDVDPRALAHAMTVAERTRRKSRAVESDALREALRIARTTDDQALVAFVQYARGVRAAELRDLEQARQLLAEVAEQDADPSSKGHAMLRLAILEPRSDRAELIEAALRHFQREGDLYGEMIARTYRMQHERDEGRFELARREGATVIELNERFGSSTVRAFGHLLLGRLLASAGEHDESHRHFRSSMDAYEELGNAHAGGLAAMQCGEVALEAGDLDAAHASFDEAARRLAPLAQPDLDLAVDAHRGILAHAWFRRTGEAAYRQRAVEIVGAIEEEFPTDDALRAVPMLASVLRRLRLRLDDGDDEVRTVATVARDGTWIARGDGEVVSLANRKAPRLILAALATSAPCSIDDLAEAGWPDETLTYESGRNRVYVAISTLRKLGLEEALVFDEDEDGYVLDGVVISSDTA